MIVRTEIYLTLTSIYSLDQALLTSSVQLEQYINGCRSSTDSHFIAYTPNEYLMDRNPDKSDCIANRLNFM